MNAKKDAKKDYIEMDFEEALETCGIKPTLSDLLFYKIMDDEKSFATSLSKFRYYKNALQKYKQVREKFPKVKGYFRVYKRENRALVIIELTKTNIKILECSTTAAKAEVFTTFLDKCLGESNLEGGK